MAGLIKTVLNALAGIFADVAGFFWGLYIRMSGDPILGWMASWWRAIARLFDQVSFGLILFRDWCMNVADEIATFLDSWDILGLLAIPIKWAQDAWDWISSAWTNVWQIVTAWWESTALPFVNGLIDIAKTWAGELINIAQIGVNLLMATWDHFWTTTLPTLATIFTVENLIDSTIKVWFPFYDELVSIWNEILEFFADPPQYVYNKLDEFFERFW